MTVQQAELEELLSDLVRIDSVTPWLIPDGAGEGAIARHIADWLSPLGVEVSLDEVEPGRPNVVARLHGTGGGASLCLNAHSDTVGYRNWAERALKPERQGDRLIGVGVADDKSSVAIGMLALREIAQSGGRPRGDVVFAATIDEEGSSVGTMDLVRRYRYDNAIILEPDAVGRAIVEHQGFGWVDVTVHGRAAHGSAPENGIDAIVHMAEVVRGLAGLYRTFEAAPDPRNGITVLHTGTISGGTDYATYPSRCVLGIEIGTQPGEKLANRVADIERVFDAVRGRYPAFSGEIKVNIERDPFKGAGNEGLIAAAREATRQVAGRDLAETGLNAWTDAALMQDAGIPTILLGAEGGNFHAPDEWVSLPECVQMVEIIRQTALRVCA